MNYESDFNEIFEPLWDGWPYPVVIIQKPIYRAAEIFEVDAEADGI